MGHVKKAAILLSALLLLAVSGCSIRPKDGTFILEGKPRSSENAFGLKDVKAQETAGKTLIGWQGNGLVLYDKTGIYVLHYDAASLTPLLTVPDESLLSAALSSNGKKLAYTLQNDQGKSALYISDADGKTDSMKLSDRVGTIWKNSAWSIEGKYVYSQYSTASGSIFNISTGDPVMLRIKESSLLMVYDIDDQSDELLFSQFQNGAPALCIARLDGLQSAVQTIDLNSWALRASFLDGSVAFLSGNTLSVVKADQPKQRQTYSDVRKYGISADKNYICLAKNNPSGSSDIYVGELRGGEIAKLTLVYEGFEPMPDRIFFSPDDQRICISGFQKGSLFSDNEMMVLTLK